MKNKRGLIILLGAVGAISGVLIARHYTPTIPSKAKPVKDFDIKKFTGKWYEIARIDTRYEKNLIKTSAQYTMNKKGGISVLNKGWNAKKNTWKVANGKGKFVGAKDIGMLKVSFFGPFYGGYNILALDKDYKYALVAGNNLDNLWILSREKKIPLEIMNEYLSVAKSVGYDTAELFWVPQY